MEHTTQFYLGLIPLMPLLGALLIGVLHVMTCKAGRIPDGFYSVVACLGPAISCIMALQVFMLLRAMPVGHQVIVHNVFTWFSVGSLHITMGFLADPLSSLFLLFITFIGTLIHIYSIGYMADDTSFAKYFAYMNLFLGSMLILVLGNGPVVMFVGWEGVGLCSYLLISYFNDEQANVLAGNKAFIVNRIGDFGFVLGIAFLFWGIGSHGFDYISLKANAHLLTPGLALLVCLLFFVGATGKSAQIPLYVWLPDAMAGPTPVSALIHAATMVTGGVYMVARFSFLYAHVPLAGDIVAWVGIITAFVAAIYGMFQEDIKKILAYSTVSQLGYMFAGVGVAAYSAGVFHVVTHAFFKALLFLCAGSVIYAMHHEQNIWKMGGLRKKLPITYWTMVIGGLALAGCPPFSGFFSKDEILFSAFANGHKAIWFIGVVTAGMTAYYTFRMIFVAFHGEPHSKEAYDHAHEPPASMIIPLLFLAAGALLAGLLNFPELMGGHQLMSHWLAPSVLDHHVHAAESTEWLAMGASVVAVVIGLIIAYVKFAGGAEMPEFTGFNKFAYNKFYIDELYNAVFVQPYKRIGSMIWQHFDPNVTDGPRRLTAGLYSMAGGAFKALQTGFVRVYAIYMVIGISLLCLLISQTLK